MSLSHIFDALDEQARESTDIVPRDVIGEILAYEEGDLDTDQIVSLFQHLIDTGMAWSLQGSYGRTAAALINAGACTPPR